MNIVSTTERAGGLATNDGQMPISTGPSFASLLRNLEQDSASMLSMPAVETRTHADGGAAGSRADLNGKIHDGAGAFKGERTRQNGGGHARSSGPFAAEGSCQAQQLPSCVLTPNAAPALQAGLGDPQFSTLQSNDATRQPSARGALPSDLPPVVMVPGELAQPAATSLARSSVTVSSMPADASASSNGLSAPDDGVAAVPHRSAQPAVQHSAGSSPNGPRVQVTAYRADAQATLAIRVPIADTVAERELLERLSLELGAHGIERYEVQLNGARLSSTSLKRGQ